MRKVVSFSELKNRHTAKPSHPSPAKGTFTEALESDIDRLCDSFEGGISRDKAVQIAADFYRKYPMLIEFVRSPEYLTRGR